jgi:hypothetical protein
MAVTKFITLVPGAHVSKTFKITSTRFCKLDRFKHIEKMFAISGRYYKPMMIVNDSSMVIIKLETSLTNDARVIIYDHHMFIVQATGNSSSLQERVLNIISIFLKGFSPGACIIKLITAAIYSFCNKLECLTLASLSSLV